MSETATQHMQCMEVWGGSQLTSRGVEMGGIDAWVYSKPYAGAKRGGDVYYASSCATGRISRLLLADVSGHGQAVAAAATDLRTLMRRYVNYLDQGEFVRSMNRQFGAMSRNGNFATAIVTTFFAPTNRLSICNAGHPRPLIYNARHGTWKLLDKIDSAGEAARATGPSNLPLGVLDIADYQQRDVELHQEDLLLCYTDALIEARDANGEFLGEEGLLERVRMLDVIEPSKLIESILAEIGGRYSENLCTDDVTVMLMRSSGRPIHYSIGQKLRAMGRVFISLLGSVNPRAPRPPLPDLRWANIGGAIFPRPAKRWRAAGANRRLPASTKNT